MAKEVIQDINKDLIISNYSNESQTLIRISPDLPFEVSSEDKPLLKEYGVLDDFLQDKISDTQLTINDSHSFMISRLMVFDC